MNRHIEEIDIHLTEIMVTLDINKDEVAFIREFCKNVGFIGNVTVLKHMVSYRIDNIVLKLLGKPYSKTLDDGLYTMKLTRYAEELGLGVKFLGGYSILVPEGVYDHQIYVMMTEYKNPITRPFDLISLIEKIKASPIKIHPDFCLKNMVMNEEQNVLMIDWDYFQYNRIFRLNDTTPRIAQKIMTDRFNGFLKGAPYNSTPIGGKIKTKKRTRIRKTK